MRHLHAETLAQIHPWRPCWKTNTSTTGSTEGSTRTQVLPATSCNMLSVILVDFLIFPCFRCKRATQRHLARCELVLEMVTRSMSWSHFLKCRAKVPLCKHKKSADSSVVWVAFNDLVWRFLLRNWGTSMGVSGRLSSSGSDLNTAFVLVYFCANGKGFDWTQIDARWSSQNVGQIWVAAHKQGLPLFGPALCPGCFWLICGDASK